MRRICQQSLTSTAKAAAACPLLTLPSPLNTSTASSRDLAHKLVRARFCDVFTRSRENALSSVEKLEVTQDIDAKNCCELG